MRRRRLVLSILVLAGMAPIAAGGREAQRGPAATAASDWTQWRGANRDAAIAGFTPPASWPAALVQRWKVDIGLGYATPLVVGNRVYAFSRQGEEEVMSALDAATGATLWKMGYAAPFTMNNATARHGAGPKSTPAFADGRLFSIGMGGIVTARDAATGRQLWQKPGSPIVPIFTTHAFAPVVDSGVVVFHLGGHNQGALTAFDVATGAERWSWPGDGPSYGSPIVATLDGTRQVITLTQTKLIGVDVATGALLWEHPFVSPNVTNAATPVLFDRTLIVSNGGPVVAVTVARRGNAWAVEPAWQNADAPYRLSNTVLSGEMLFGLSTRNTGQYFGLDVRTGASLWSSEGRQAMQAAVERAGDWLFSLEDDGELLVIRSDRTKFDVVTRYKVADDATWTPPVISGNRVFVKDVSTLTLWTLN